jgi:hypothetical protein
MELTEEQKMSIDKRMSDVPIKYKKLYKRCISGQASPRMAIKMHCLECWGWQNKETMACDNAACPLFNHRPYQNGPSPSLGEAEDEDLTNGN